MQHLAWKRNKTVSFVEFLCTIVFGIDKQTYQASLFCDEDRPINCFREQQAAIALSLVFSGNGKSRKANGRKSMLLIFLCICCGKMRRSDFAERESKIPEDCGRFFLIREHKSA